MDKYLCYRHRRGFTIACALLALVNLAAFGFFTLPARWGAHTAVTSLSEAEQSATEAETYRDFLATSVNRLDENRNAIAGFYTKTLSTKREKMTAVMGEIRALAALSDITYTDVGYNFRESPEQPGLMQFTISLPLEGTYGSFRKFISGIEHAESFLILQDVNLSNVAIDRYDLIKMTLTLATYFLDDESANTPAALLAGTQAPGPADGEVPSDSDTASAGESGPGVGL